MATIKICISIEQSKKLIELGINVNTADIIYNIFDVSYIRHDTPIDKYHIPAWSLSALLELMPDKIVVNGENYFLNFTKKSVEYRGIVTWDGQKCISKEAENLLDAVFEMVCWLLENEKL